MAFGSLLGQSAPSVDFSGVGNLYVWKISSVSHGAQQTFSSIYSRPNQTDVVTYTFGNTLLDVVFEINVNTTTATWGGYNNLYSLLGKFCKSSTNKGIVYFIDSNATFSQRMQGSYYYIDCSSGYQYTNVSIISEGYITSEYPDAYPQNGVVGEKLYEYVGQVGDGARSVIGSYVGTGQYGSSNPNELTFDFEPKIVIIQEVSGNMRNLMAIRGIPQINITGSGSSFVDLNWDKNTLSYYADSADIQLNSSGRNYIYLALG